MGSRKTQRRARARRRRGLRNGIPLGYGEVPPYVELEMKITCRRCKVPKDAEKDFYPRSGTPTGYQYECKECRKEINESYRKKKRSKEVKRGRPKGAYDKQVRVPRDHKGERREKMLKDAGAKIAAGELVAETPRSLAFLLRIIVEQQLRLFYGRQVNGAPIRVRMNEIISDADFEIKEALSRVGVRMKPVIRSAQTDVTTTLTSMLAKAEALKLLEVEEGASTEQIKQAYRKLALKAHPDRGGSEKAMQSLNAARDLLLEEANG